MRIRRFFEMIPSLLLRLAVIAAMASLVGTRAWGTEGSGCVYPIGAETVLPGLTPAAGQTMFAEFNTTYQSNAFLDGQGHSSVSDFRLSVYAFAPKITHNWGLHLLGGNLVSWAAFPFANITLQTPAGRYTTTGISNPLVGTDIAYNHGDWHWWYGLDVMTPAPVYHKGGPINVGQHNFATTPEGAFTYLPATAGRNSAPACNTSSTTPMPPPTTIPAMSFFWSMWGWKVSPENWPWGSMGHLPANHAGPCSGRTYNGGNQGRDLAIGPEVRYQLGPMVLSQNTSAIIWWKTGRSETPSGSSAPFPWHGRTQDNKRK